MGAGHFKTNTSLGIDPDWGKKALSAALVFKVTVTPADKKLKKWSFYILVPEQKPTEVNGVTVEDDEETLEERVEALRFVCEAVLEEGDYYEMMQVGNDDIESFDQSTPVLAYNPLDETEWLWLCPPNTCRH